jgi:hypothetical protein
MRVRGPLDLPDFRLWLMDQWRPTGHFTALSRGHHRTQFAWEDCETPGMVNPAVERHNIPRAELWWVSAEFSALIDHAARSIPSTTLTEDLLPCDHGLVVFDQPLTGVTADTGENVPIAAMSWCRLEISDGGKYIDGLNAVPYRFIPQGAPGPAAMVPLDGKVKPDRVATIAGQKVGIIYGVEHEDAWLPCGITHWLMGADTDAADDDESDLQTASLSEDRRWLATLWLLASQPLAESRVERAPRMTARRSQRAKVASDVRLVDLRRRAGGGSSEREPTGLGRRPYDHRFIVAGPDGDGFWRQQACGPGWSQHRPVWIAPFVKGPTDKPLKLRETVKVVR